jgi:hypothetical protein
MSRACARVRRSAGRCRVRSLVDCGDAGLGEDHGAIEEAGHLGAGERTVLLLHQRGRGLLRHAQTRHQRRGCEPGGELLVEAEFGVKRVGDGALGGAEELQPAGSDHRHLASEPLLEDELGLEPAGELVEPGAHDGDGGLVVGALAQTGAERVDGGAGFAEDDLLLGREVAEDRRARDVGRVGDLVDRRSSEALAGEQLHRRVADRVARRALAWTAAFTAIGYAFSESADRAGDTATRVALIAVLLATAAFIIRSRRTDDHPRVTAHGDP